MKKIFATTAVMLFLFTSTTFGEETKGVNEIRKEIVGLYDQYIGLIKELKELEKNAKDFPATTLNISLVKKARGAGLTHVDILIDNQPLESHAYSQTENDALDAGGRHVLYKSEIKKGNHTLKVLLPGKGTASMQFEMFAGSDLFIQISVNKNGEVTPEQITF